MKTASTHSDVLSVPHAFALIGLIVALFFPASIHAAETLYTCGMHPQVIKKEPGNCPICGMKLTPIRANSQNGDSPSSSAASGPVASGNQLQIDAATTQRMNLKTALVREGPVRREFRAVGAVVYNEEGLLDITTKYEGWIEKLYVNKTWAVIKAGDPLFEIYSPDLYNAQLNYLVALRTEPNGDGPMTRASLGRLQLFDVPQALIEELKARGTALRTFLFRAASDGVVIEKMVTAGQMMKPGERVFRLADLSTVWVEAQVYEKDLPFVREGQPVIVHSSYGAERAFEGKVQVILPQVQEQTRTITVRIEIQNTDRFLRPGMYVDANFSARLTESAVLVPDVAVLRSGERNTVFVALDAGFFEPREVTLGVRSSDNFYEVLAGLRAGERVVTSGQFMLDSESQLREAIQKMLKSSVSESAPAAAAQATPASQAAAVSSATGRAAEREPLADLALIVADQSAALGADDFATYKKRRPEVQTALAATLKAGAPAELDALAPFSAALPEPTSIEEARAEFFKLSSALVEVVRARHLHHRLGLHIFECPMAPGGTGRWLQRSTSLLNPFFGSEMPTCGTEIEGPTASFSRENVSAPLS